MRLRRKPWVDEAIHEFDDFVVSRDQEIGEEKKGKWSEIFGRQAPLHVELGTGKGDFISQLAELHPDINYIGIEMQQDVLYSAAKKIAEKELKNVRLLVFNINHIEDIFAEGEVDRFYINFCDPWPKKRHAKRRLTHVGFLEKYRRLLKKPGELHFKTDNRPLFDFTLEELEAVGAKPHYVTYDLHASPENADNVETEYEKNFSAKGFSICALEVTAPAPTVPGEGTPAARPIAQDGAEP